MAVNSYNVFLQVIFYVIFLHQILMVQNECVGRFSLSDEEDNPILNKFLETLEIYSGLSGDYQMKVPVICPNSGVCTVNPQGSAIWQARLEFYTPYVINSTGSDVRTQTLDKCICSSQKNSEFQHCLKLVRHKMLEELSTKMLPRFKSIVESGSCATFGENCL